MIYVDPADGNSGFAADERMGSPAFGDLLDAAFPWESGTIVVLRAYFDASQRKSGVFCVAGVAFGVDRAKKADRAWRTAFDGRRMHMADLHARQGDFAGISDSDADRYCRSAVRIINRHSTAVATVSCDVEDVERLRPKDPQYNSHQIMDIARSAYNCCLHWTMMALGTGIGDGQRIQYWFERGDNFQGASRRFLETLNDWKHEPLRHSYCYGSDAFVSKADAPLFDAADFVAWEWGKHVERVRAGQHVRPSLIALMGDDCVLQGRPWHDSAKRRAMHAAAEPMGKYFRKMAALVAASGKEEIVAAMQMD